MNCTEEKKLTAVVGLQDSRSEAYVCMSRTAFHRHSNLDISRYLFNKFFSPNSTNTSISHCRLCTTASPSL